MIRGVIFDLDGVLVATDELHYAAWKRLADGIGVRLDERARERFRGVGRLGSLEVVLEGASRTYSQEEKLALAERKNAFYQESLRGLTRGDLAAGVRELLDELRRRGLKLAVASSSKNAPILLERIGLNGTFDAVISGNDIARSKPDPEVFLATAARLGLPPRACLVVEDAPAGIEAARRAGMAVFGIGTAETLPGVARLAPSLAQVAADDLLAPGGSRS